VKAYNTDYTHPIGEEKGMKLTVTGIETIVIKAPRHMRINLSNLVKYKGQKLTAKELLRICGYSPKTALSDTRVQELVEYVKKSEPPVYLVKFGGKRR